MDEDSSVVHETVGSVLSDAVETLYQVRLASLAGAGEASEGLSQAYSERDRFKIRFLKALLGEHRRPNAEPN